MATRRGGDCVTVSCSSLSAWGLRGKDVGGAVLFTPFAGRLLGHTEPMDITEAQCAVVATQLKKLTVKQIRIADKRYTVCFHSPLARLVGQMSVNPYDKQGTMEGFYALQTERDHGCIVIWCVKRACTFDAVDYVRVGLTRTGFHVCGHLSSSPVTCL